MRTDPTTAPVVPGPAPGTDAVTTAGRTARTVPTAAQPRKPVADATAKVSRIAAGTAGRVGRHRWRVAGRCEGSRWIQQATSARATSMAT